MKIFKKITSCYYSHKKLLGYKYLHNLDPCAYILFPDGWSRTNNFRNILYNDNENVYIFVHHTIKLMKNFIPSNYYSQKYAIK